MLLSGVAIKKLVDSKELIIDPLPEPDSYKADTVDASLGTEFRVFIDPVPELRATVRAWSEEFDFDRLSDRTTGTVQLNSDGVWILEPGQFALGYLRERVELPKNIAMHLQGRSRYARIGLSIHVTAPHAHAGWKGVMQLELYNFGKLPIELKPGTKIAQLSFWQVLDPMAEVPKGYFDDQKPRTSIAIGAEPEKQDGTQAKPSAPKPA